MSSRLNKIQHYRKGAQELRSEATRNFRARDVLLSIAESYEHLAGDLEANTVGGDASSDVAML